MRDQLRVVRQTALASMAELAAVYTWRTWVFTWLLRLIVQVTFFGLVGRMIGSEEQVTYLVVGNAVVIVALETSVAVMTTYAERTSGTLALMVAAPATHLTVYLGRGLHTLATGIVTSNVAFLVVMPLFGLPLPWPRVLLVPVMIAVVGVCAYFYSVFLSGLVLGAPQFRWVVLNLSYLVLMTFAGVNVPVSYWPDWIGDIVSVLPVTHGLKAIRALLADGPVPTVVGQLALEVGVGVLWLAAASVVFSAMVRRGRVTGAIEFGS